jgi:hypothetical protein
VICCRLFGLFSLIDALVLGLLSTTYVPDAVGLKSLPVCKTYLIDSLLFMARAKTKSSAKDRICSDPFIVDDDDGHSAVASEDDYEAVSNDESVFLFFLCDKPNDFRLSGESLGDVSEDSLDEEEWVLFRHIRIVYADDMSIH